MQVPEVYCAPFHESSNRPHLMLGCEPTAPCGGFRGVDHHRFFRADVVGRRRNRVSVSVPASDPARDGEGRSSPDFRTPRIAAL